MLWHWRQFGDYTGLTHVLTAEEITKGGGDIISLIRRLGINVSTGVRNQYTGEIYDAMYIRGKYIPISDELRHLDVFDLEAIGIAYPPGGLPTVVPILKPFNERMKKPRYNVTIITPLGYQKPAEFYSPQYDTPKARNKTTPDLRSTIYWKPDVITESAGKASLYFYTAGNPATYSAIIEGVTSDGKLIYQRSNSLIIVE